jgi:hypothetical protein
LIYLAEGDKVNAALSAAAMIPGTGMAATGAKYGKKAAAAATEAVGKKAGREAAEAGLQKSAKEAEETAAKKRLTVMSAAKTKVIQDAYCSPTNLKPAKREAEQDIT